MIAMKEVRQKYFLRAEMKPLYRSMHSHIQKVHFVIPENKVGKYDSLVDH